MLFNLLGYKLVIHYLHSKGAAQLVAQIENCDYADADLVSIKTPLSLPYYSNSETYERVDGVVCIEGKYYNYVKRRVYNDSLELLCLPNTTKADLEKAEATFSKSVSNSEAAEKSSKKPVVVKNVLPEFCGNDTYSGGIPGIGAEAACFSSFTFFLPNTYLVVLSPPPDVMHVTA